MWLNPPLSPTFKLTVQYHGKTAENDTLWLEYPYKSRQPVVVELRLEPVDPFDPEPQPGTSGALTIIPDPRSPRLGQLEEVERRRTLWWPMDRIPIPAAANSLLDTIAPYARIVLAGARIDYTTGTALGVYDDDSEAAIATIATVVQDHEHAADPSQTIEGEHAEFWYDPELWGAAADSHLRDLAEQVTADTEPTNLEGIAYGIEQDALRGPTPTVLYGVQDYITRYHAELCAAERDAAAKAAASGEQLDYGPL